MINIFRSIALSLLGLISIGWISIILIITMFAKPGDTWLTNFVADVLIMNEQLESFNRTFADVSDGIFQLMATISQIDIALYGTLMSFIGSLITSRLLLNEKVFIKNNEEKNEIEEINNTIEI